MLSNSDVTYCLIPPLLAKTDDPSVLTIDKTYVAFES